MAAANKLTAKQEQFCLIYWERGNAAAAYRLAYDADKMNAASVYSAAAELLKNPKITPRLEQLRAAMRERTEVSLADHLVDLERLRDIAVADGEISAAIKAESLRGDALGYYVQKKESGKPGEFGKRTAAEIKASIMERNVRLGFLKLVPKAPAPRKTAKKRA